MSLADWTDLDNVLSIPTVLRGATAGQVPPAGGGPNVFEMRSTVETTGAYGKFVNIESSPPGTWTFAPLIRGGSIRGCVKRLGGAGTTKFSPFLFIGARTNDVNAEGYLLGLEDADPYRIVLRKGTIIAGIPVATSASGGGTARDYLMRSTAQYAASSGLWHHLRLDMIVQGGGLGDTDLRVYENDLAAHHCDAPSWVAIPGMSTHGAGLFTDDVAGMNSGTDPFSGGYAGFAGAWAAGISRTMLHDYIQVRRQP